MVALERPTASWSDLIPTEPLENLLACPLSEVSLEHALSDPLKKETLKHALVSPLTEKTLKNVCVFSMTEQPRENVLPCPLKGELLAKFPDSPRTSESLEIIQACPLTLEHALVSALRMDEPMENVPASPLPEKMLANVLVSPMTLSVDPFWGARSFFITKPVLLSPHLVSDEMVVLILQTLVTHFILCPYTHY